MKTRDFITDVAGAKLKVLSLYPNMMDLYGDSGNLQILKYRAAQRGVELTIDSHIVGDKAPKFAEYDLVFMGGGSDKEQKVVAADIVKYRKEIRAAYEEGVFFLVICGGFQLFGKSYKDAEGNVIPGVGLFDYTTESSPDKQQRCIGNIVIETKIDDLYVQLVGFENHGGQTHGITEPFGEVVYGNGNKFGDKYEGLRTANFIGTYLHGPLLSKNPELADDILQRMLGRKLGGEVRLEMINDYFEKQARGEMLMRLL